MFDPRYLQNFAQQGHHVGHHVGNYDIVGYEDIVGAVPPAAFTGVQPGFGPGVAVAPPGNGAFVRAVQPMVPWMGASPQVGVPVPVPGSKGSVLLDKTATGVMRRQILGFGSQSVAAGGTITLNAQPQRTMRLEKLVLTASATGLLLTGLNIGADPQFVNVGSGVPVEMFAATALENLLRSVTANLGHVISLQLQNPTAGAITIAAGAIGESLD